MLQYINLFNMLHVNIIMFHVNIKKHIIIHNFMLTQLTNLTSMKGAEVCIFIYDIIILLHVDMYKSCDYINTLHVHKIYNALVCT